MDQADYLANTMVCFEHQKPVQIKSERKSQSVVVRVDELAREVNYYLNQSSDRFMSHKYNQFKKQV